MKELDYESIVKMHKLSHRPEGEDEILIGRPDVSDFIILPSVALDIIESLDSGLTIGQVKKEIEDRLGEEVDVLDFVNDLIHEYKFVYTLNGNVVNEPVEHKILFPWLNKRLSKLLFNNWSFVLYFVLSLLGIVAIILNPTLFPVYSDMFFSESYTVSIIVTTLVAWVFVLVHELAHLMAARSSGVESQISISHRLVFLVVETDMSNIVLLEKKERYKALLAGLAWDGSFFGIGTFMLYLNNSGLLNLTVATSSIIKMITLVLILKIAFQFLFFMKTDIYYIFTNRFNCKNLLHHTGLYLYRLVKSFNEQQKHEWEMVEEHERKIIKWYAWFYVAGYIWAVSLFIVYALPQTYTIVTGTVNNISNLSFRSSDFWDGIILLVITLVPLSLLIRSWLKELKQRRSNNVSNVTEVNNVNVD
ncbi:PqqD family protein [Cytobacillus sp. Hm23]